MDKQTDIEVLEEFINDNVELERLEEIAEDFNIFTALGIADTEIRHSNFLAWLMEPSESHGLGDYFLASFLKKAAFKASALGLESPSVFDIDSWHFDSAEIMREHRKIDILIRCDEHRLVCAIENKIHSGEHGRQLQRYRDIVQKEFPAHDGLLIYLTIDVEIPSDENYIPLSYSEIMPLIDHVIESKTVKIGSEILTFITHYREMLRRYIMEDSEIQDICRKIYRRHKRALDLIFEYKPDKQMKVYECLVNIIGEDPDLILDDSSKSTIRFIAKDMDFIPKVGDGWTKSKRMLLFEIGNKTESANLYLIIGPGPEEIRMKLHEIAREDSTLFPLLENKRNMGKYWSSIYKKPLLKARDYEEKEIDDLSDILKERLRAYKESDWPKIMDIFRKSFPVERAEQA